MVALISATPGDRPTFENLLQLYCHDWSEIIPLGVDDRGRFADYPLDAYFRGDAGYHPLLLRVDGALAGFALVAERSRLTGQEGVFDMAEFFVLRGHRRRGVGLTAAHALFDRFRGPWEVRERAENVAAIAFWRRAIDAYTGGNYREVVWDEARWKGTVQSFNSAR